MSDIQSRHTISIFVASLFTEGLLYGTHAFIFGITLFIALGSKPRRFANGKLIVKISSLMMLSSTIHLIIDSIQVFDAIMTPRTLEELQAFSLHSGLAMASVSWYIVQVMIGDGVLAWRCYILYDRTVWVVLPGLVVLLLDAGILLIVKINPILPQGMHAIWIPVFLTLSICLHIGYTESGAIYTVTATIMLVCAVVGSPGQFVLGAAIPPLIGICFCLMVLQVHVHHSSEGGEMSSVGMTANLTIPWAKSKEER
ncbi:hypothetical protein D9756_000052 [Leucocoprinus leucothites]|uniref:Uncharacterized protein n=1 Tax=Leucocoprinus leucothites TaxID=201217 RepID=A0A8H5GEF9_9AGAR|nr:hypothetical protein D9756_000052 [Leucoagaricus leucothites]